MWKKFTDLLFEDDDTIEEDVEQEIVVEKPKKVVKPITIEEPKPTPVFVEPAKIEEPVVVEEKTKTPISMVVDDLQEVKPQQKPVEQTQQNRLRPRIVPVSKTEPKNTYEFTPVISPIFGISEKDVDAVIPTNPNKKKAVPDSKIGTVISPMYGIDRDNEPDTIVGKVSPKQNSVEEVEAEEEVPNFSLDDILARRNLDNNDEKTKFFKTSDLENDVDRTVVLSSLNMSLFDDEE